MVSPMVWLGCLAAFCPTARAIDVLDSYQPSTGQSIHGPVSRIKFSTGLVRLGPHLLVHSPAGTMRDFQFSEPVWVIGYKSTIHDRDGRTPRENYLCHTMFGDQRVVQRQDQQMRALYSDGFTPEVRLPEGLAMPFTARDKLHWMPMFNNRGAEPAEVEMRVEITLIRDRDLKRPLHAVYSTLRSVQMPHLFYVAPKRQERETTFELPFNGRLHFIGTHIHPHGESIELFNLSSRRLVWKGTMKESGMEVYSSAQGYEVRVGDRFRLSSVYNNPTAKNIDAMAAVFLFYSVN